MKTGIIIAHLGIKVTVEFNDHTQSTVRVARNSGHVVGDRVVVEHERLKRLERTTELKRRTRFGDQVVAANIDAVFIVVAVAPKIPNSFIDRVIVAARSQHIQTFIVVNKSDLPESEELFVELKHNYDNSVGVYALSVRANEGLDVLENLIAQTGRCALIGVSGVGKSSLLNALVPSANLVTSTAIDPQEHGKHITTVSNLFRLPSGGELIDTPGVREFEPIDVTAAELAHLFPGFEKFLSTPCKFRDCLHITEPGCTVRNAVEKGELSKERYEAYSSQLFAGK